MPKSKFYKITDIDALAEFNEKAVTYEPVVDNALVLRMLRDFSHVPGVERITDEQPTASALTS